jgi:hypothetical protein
MIKFGQNNTLSINKPMYDVLCHIRTKLINGKLSRLRPMGNHVSVPCPFHSNGLERNNSCGIQENGTFHCFTCEAKGKF